MLATPPPVAPSTPAPTPGGGTEMAPANCRKRKDDPCEDDVADPRKLRALARYVIWRAADKGGCTAIRLFKILWCSEVNHYVRSGRLITGVKYVRSRHGLRPICWDDICRHLESSKGIHRWTEKHLDAEVTKFAAIQEPHTELLSQSELECVEYWVDKVDDFLGGQKSMIFRESAGD